MMNSFSSKEKIKGVVLGVSGGADSVALLSFFIACKSEINSELRIRVVHVNHMIRGEEADSDQRFVENLCEKLGVEYKVYKENIPAMAAEMNMTEEEAGRNFRYKVFRENALELEQETGGECRIAVAHNKDDLAETVLYNMIRGSSILGLAGIKPVRERIIRPLLDTPRVELEAYLEELGQDYVTDSTNLDTEYTRNKIRHLIMPEIKKLNSGAVDHIADVARDALELGDDISNIVSNDKTVKENPVGEYTYPDGRKQVIYDKQEISIAVLSSLPRIARGEVVLEAIERVCGRRKDITREHIRQVCELVWKENGKRVNLPYGMVASRVYDRIVIKNVSSGESRETDDKNEGRIVITEMTFSDHMEISKKEYTKMIDCGKIKSTLVLRKPSPDDYIVISKNGGSKKLSRYFTAEKVERDRRQDIPVVADGDEIVWIVGMRLSERYKVGPDTEKVAVIDYVKN
ncbi:MAG: tRNA lysidine(34) synthetase TilS [Eubacterium sp.]|nr:tRNA lysidine(34) synthetase TilS [Eubacterium sp.]